MRRTISARSEADRQRSDPVAVALESGQGGDLPVRPGGSSRHAERHRRPTVVARHLMESSDQALSPADVTHAGSSDDVGPGQSSEGCA
jgi:hypothetical protein